MFIEGAKTEEIDAKNDNTHHPPEHPQDQLHQNAHCETNVHQLTTNSPTINTLKNTVNKTQSALNAHEDPLTLATTPLDHVKTHKMEFDMLNMDRNSAKE